MRGSVFMETLRQSRNLVLYTGLGFAAIGLFMVIIIPNADGLKQMVEFMDTLPPILLAATGIGDDIQIIGTPEGFLAFGIFGKMVLFFVVYSVIVGLNVTANEEDNGIMDMVLSWPLPRWQVIVEKFVAYTLTIAFILTLLFVGMWLGTIFINMPLNMGHVVALVFNMMPTMTFVLGFTILIAAVLRQKRYIIGLVTAFIMGSYMLQTVGAMAKGTIAENVQWVSFFTYFDINNVVKSGLNPVYVIGLLAGAVLMVTGSLWAYQRRDIGL